MAGGDKAQPLSGGLTEGPEAGAGHLDVQTDRLHLAVRIQVHQGGTPRLHTARMAAAPHTGPRAKASRGVSQGASVSSQEEELDNP